MSKPNPLAGLIGYGDSDDETQEPVYQASRAPDVAGRGMSSTLAPPLPPAQASDAMAGIHPAPIPHCPWSACYDEGSGFTYYWNQQTNAVTWEAPPEYLLALKLAQQQLHTAGSEVSAEEWQLYQQALAEKQNTQNKVISKSSVNKPAAKKNDRPVDNKNKKFPNSKKRAASDDDEEKIELITSYYHSDSESNDEPDTPVKSSSPPKPPAKLPKHTQKKQKIAPPVINTEYGPSLPPNQSYTVPIGPELPPNSLNETKPKEVEKKVEFVAAKEEEKKPLKVTENDDSQDERLLLIKLKDKAKLLEKLGGEIPSELQKIIEDETRSATSSPKVVDDTKPTLGTNIDDLLEEIEKKELPKVKSKAKIDIFSDDNMKSKESSARNSPRSIGDLTPPREELKSLFPSSKAIEEEKPSLFPSAQNIQENDVEIKKSDTPPLPEKKPANIYLMDSQGEKPRKKLRISNSVLPERKKVDVPAYTTKYSQHIEGFSSERTGLGFSKEEDSDSNPKSTISYGNGLAFTKGETLNEDKKDEALDDLTDLVEAKLKYLNQLQPSIVSPVQEMLIQMQTLVSAYRSGALTTAYWRRWSTAAGAALADHERSAAPPGWSCTFCRSEQRYRYRRLADGLEQWEYPAVAHTDMDICTTPPHPGIDAKQQATPPAPAPAPPLPPPPPPPPRAAPPATPPPPPAWHDPPPPGCDDLPSLPPEPPKPKQEVKKEVKKQEIGDELLSFYNDIAELEKITPPAPVDDYPATPPPPPPPDLNWGNGDSNTEKVKEKERDSKEAKISKKKSKVKISSSMGMKQKSVSSMVAKWQQVADEINSD